MKFKGDIDIDLGDRSKLLELIKHTPASIRKDNTVKKHASGIYITDIPYDPITNTSSIDYNEAESRGYFKLDILNVHLYNQIKNEQHLLSLMNDPKWENLYDSEFCSKLIHIGKHYDTIVSMPEPIDNISKLAMLLAIIRPSKRYLIGKRWDEVSKTIWDKDNDGYVFKRSHSYAYSKLVIVNMNLLDHSLNQGNTTFL
jgi:hypothetical protein